MVVGFDRIMSTNNPIIILEPNIVLNTAATIWYQMSIRVALKKTIVVDITQDNKEIAVLQEPAAVPGNPNGTTLNLFTILKDAVIAVLDNKVLE